MGDEKLKMRTWDDGERERMLFYKYIYLYIYILFFPLYHSTHQFHLLLMSACAARKTRRQEGRGKDGGVGGLDELNEDGC